MSDRPHLFPGEPPAAALALAPAGVTLPAVPDTADTLSAPGLDDLTRSFYALLPAGAAWRSPDGAAFEEGTMLGRFWRAIAGDFVTLYRGLFGLSLESTAATLVDSLEDWEDEYGLPDPCFGEVQTRHQRLRALLLKIRSGATLTVADFIALAGSAGYEISISEPMSFECGVSQCGGADQMGGAIEYFWIVKVSGVPIDRFESGVSQCGVDALTDFGRADDLECLFRRLAPAWTMPIFDYS
ncbi:putative phage tail protein [Mesorhizobium sp. KR2-14]|uniref:putative phage tail protein n=1 Tax=Mesorhizobium sp. KR2-14 TaxID=3156610 RepID=UPI0032B5E924